MNFIVVKELDGSELTINTASVEMVKRLNENKILVWFIDGGWKTLNISYETFVNTLMVRR